MGYQSIKNLYRPEISREILLLDEVYIMEKIHGTSAHIAYHNEAGFSMFSGGIKPESFEIMIAKRFGLTKLQDAMKFELAADRTEVIFYGEAYGGNCQKMSSVYGPLNFIVFEVKLDGEWLEVPLASLWADIVGLPFVWYTKCEPHIEILNAMRDAPSMQASRNDMGKHIGEGIVIRPTNEDIKDRFGNRIVAKHKTEKFCETKRVRQVDPLRAEKLKAAQAIAEEWVTMQRLTHVVDHLRAAGCEPEIQATENVIGEMLKDVRIEAGVGGEHPEIEWNRDVQKAISCLTSGLFHKWLGNQIGDAKWNVLRGKKFYLMDQRFLKRRLLYVQR